MKQVTTIVLDDIDGTPGAETHTVSVDGYTVTIDLAEPNRKALYEALRPFLDAGQRVPGSRREPRRPAPTPPPSGPTRSAIRVWWKNNPDGLPTWQQRGAIPAAVADAWSSRGQP